MTPTSTATDAPDPVPPPVAHPPVAPEPVLRTLAPALRNLERKLNGWLDGRHTQPLKTIDRATMEGLAQDLTRQADALDVDRPLLVVMLMGGTGVGKSSLLNALAGGTIAQASFTRPTTRDPVVYYHETVKPDRLDPALRVCRLAAHDRETLVHKILVDTPDVDSNDLANRERLLALLPVADIVLYVGSQEKYHDQLGWELFKQQRKRRAFAFVLNKWDRCLHQAPDGDGSSIRPDDDLLRDLHDEGFSSPLLFRTAAQRWIDHAGAGSNGPPPDLPPGEQFRDLTNWLENGLSRLEIEAVKARGVSQLFDHMQQALGHVRPPDLTAEAEKTRAAWEALLENEAGEHTEVLVGTLDPYQSEIEHHFSVEGQHRFHGLMALYLKAVTRVRYAGNALRDRVPFLPKISQGVETPTSWDVGAFTRECSRVASERVLDRRGTAFVNRLLVEADQQGFPTPLLSEPAAHTSRLDWRSRYDRALIDTLTDVEKIWTHPTGPRRVMQSTLVTLANFLPSIAFIATAVMLCWRYFMPAEGERAPDTLNLWWLVLIVPLLTMVVLHLLIELLLPMRWPAIRGEFRRRLNKRLVESLHDAYAPIPGDVAAALVEDRKRVEQLQADVGEVAEWLAQREQAANIQGLYGK
jgi:50S ribosome-binding GTPase